jgi:hypothetical protein
MSKEARFFQNSKIQSAFLTGFHNRIQLFSLKTIEQKMKAIFQFFYSSKIKELPHQSVPTRDVTNSCGQGHKTEPNLERQMENWCSCRPKPVTTAAIAAKKLDAKGEKHYLVLTTRHPETGQAFAVGLMPFSEKNHTAALRKYKERWGERRPYVSDHRMKICSFSDSFPLDENESKDGSKHVPGSRYALVHVPDELLGKIINHFESKKNKTDAFLKNVRALEKILSKTNPEAFQEYRQRNDNFDGHC